LSEATVEKQYRIHLGILNLPKGGTIISKEKLEVWFRNEGELEGIGIGRG